MNSISEFKKKSISEVILFYLIIFYPLFFVFRSATLNFTTVLISLITIYLILKKKQFYLINNFLVIWLGCFMVFVVINSIYHQQNFELLIKSFGNFRYLALTVGVMMVLKIISKKQEAFLINFNIILLTIISLDIIHQFFFYNNIFGITPGMCNNGLIECFRFSGIFGTELIAGAYLSQIGSLFCLFYLATNIKNETKYIFNYNNFFLLLLFTTIVITGERNALLIFLLAISLILLINKKIVQIILTLIVVFFIISVSSKFSNQVNMRLNEPLKQIKNSSLTNFLNNIKNSPWGYHYSASLELFEENPIFGHGNRSFRVACKNTDIQKKLIIKKSEFFACATHPHNYLLEQLSENGIFGGIFYLGILIYLIIQILKLNKINNSKEKFLLIGVTSLLIAIIFPLKPSGSFFSTFNSSMFFYILGYFLHLLTKNNFFILKKMKFKNIINKK